jgi:hypothetical protein
MLKYFANKTGCPQMEQPVFVTRPGFEPRQAESESDVLPLHYRAITTVKKSRNYFRLFVGLLGFEPRQTESKSVVLPLHHNPIVPQFYLGLQK